MEAAIGKKIGDRVRTLRQSKGVTVAVLQKRLFGSHSYLYLVERGEKLPTLPSLLRICDALGIGLGDFFAGWTAGSWRAKRVKNGGLLL